MERPDLHVDVWPIYWGSYERYAGIQQLEPARALAQTELRIRWYTEIKRTLDYLESRPDVEPGAHAFLGYSYGASHSLPLLAFEDRFKAAIMVTGGLGDLGIRPMPSAADPFNFVPRVTLPVLMLNGSRDFVFPLETSQLPMFELLGTPPEHKRHVVYDADHASLPRTEVFREIADWLDRYLGRVHGKGSAAAAADK